MFVVDWLAPVVRLAVAPLWARWEGSPYLAHYRRLLRTQYDPPGVVRVRQLAAVTDLLRHAYKTTPFWRQRLDGAGMRPERVQSFDDFRAVPLVTKHDLRTHAGTMISDGFDRATLHEKKTSGSTGVSVGVFVDETAMQFKRACTLRSDEWTGWRLGERAARLWGNPPLRTDWRGRLRSALLERSEYLDTLRMDEAAMLRFLGTLRRRPPSLLFGHAHSLYLFAEFVRANGGPGFRPRGILSTAMVLHDWERRAIEDVFDRPVTNRYGSEEVSLIACECEKHNGLHVNADGVYVEILRPDGRPARPGEAGAVVVTDLINRAMPLLRYQVGDVAVMTDRVCPCGRGLPLLEGVEGREADYVTTPDGRMISGISLTENFAMLVSGVAQMQVVQVALDRVVFRIVRGSDFGPHSVDQLRELAAERFGPGIVWTCEYLPRIPPEPTGKYRFCISKVKNRFARLQETAAHEARR